METNRFVVSSSLKIMIEKYVKILERENDHLKAENDKLTKHVDKYGGIAYDKLQAKYDKLNDEYNNDHKVHNDYEDGLLKEIKELKHELKKAKCGDINQ